MTNDFGHILIFFVTIFVWVGSEQDDFLLELEDWVRAAQISVEAGRLTYFCVSAAE